MNVSFSFSFPLRALSVSPAACPGPVLFSLLLSPGELNLLVLALQTIACWACWAQEE